MRPPHIPDADPQTCQRRPRREAAPVHRREMWPLATSTIPRLEGGRAGGSPARSGEGSNPVLANFASARVANIAFFSLARLSTLGTLAGEGTRRLRGHRLEVHGLSPSWLIREAARCFPGPRERWGWRGKTGFAGTRYETKLTAYQGNFVFVSGGSLFGGEKGQRPSAPAEAASAALNPLLSGLRKGSLPARAETLSPEPWLTGEGFGASPRARTARLRRGRREPVDS